MFCGRICSTVEDGNNKKEKKNKLGLFARLKRRFYALFDTERPQITIEKKVPRDFPRLTLTDIPMEFEYNMNNPKRGIALVFNHEHVLHHARRSGTANDRISVERSLRRLGFQTEIFDDLETNEVEGELTRGEWRFSFNFQHYC
jgi:hypothetical protein